MNMSMQVMPINHKNQRYQGCSTCLMSHLCEMAGEKHHKYQMTKIHQRSYMINQKQSLLRSGSKGGSIYAICNGTFKSVHHSDGDSRVVDVHLPGEALGLESYVGSTETKYDLIANEQSTISEFILPDYNDIESASFLKDLVTLSGSQFLRLQDKQETLGGKKSTLELVASFIHSLAKSHCSKNIIIAEFKLPLTRSEIAGYLGLASETISRQFVLLEKMKVFKTKGQRITILDFTKLQGIGSAQYQEKQAAA